MTSHPEYGTVYSTADAADLLEMTGIVYAMSDSVADAWVASGGIAPGDRLLAVFAESFIEVASVTVSGR